MTGIKRIGALLLCLCLMASGLYTLKALAPSEAYGEGTTPGSADDPVVTKSYVDQKIYESESALKSSIDALSSKVDSIQENAAYNPDGQSSSGQGGNSSGSSGSSSGQSGESSGSQGSPSADSSEYDKYLKFVVVEVSEGGKLIGSMGTEIILRAGTAVAIDNGADGITDLSSGADLKSGESVIKNHLIIVPRTDGRGVICTSYCYFMVKGEYSVVYSLE